MKTIAVSIVLAALAGCASTQVPPGMAAGKFVQFACADGKSFRARAAEDGASVRVRALHGSAELDRKPDGSFEGDGYKLVTEGSAGATLIHSGKPEATRCKAAA